MTLKSFFRRKKPSVSNDINNPFRSSVSNDTNRKIFTAGYGYDTETSLAIYADKITGAKTRGKSYSSPTPNYTLNYRELLRQARITYWDSPEARSLVGRFKDIVIGKGLDLVPSPVWSKLNLGSESDNKKREEILQDISDRWLLWADSLSVMANGKNTLYTVQSKWYEIALRDGGVFVRFLIQPDNKRLINPLRLETILYSSLTNPDAVQLNEIKSRGHTACHGIEVNAFGEEQAIYVRSGITDLPVRLPFFYEDGSRALLHFQRSYLSDNDLLGVSILANKIHEFDKIQDYKVAELEAAVVNATLAGYVKPSKEAAASKPFRPSRGVELSSGDGSVLNAAEVDAGVAIPQVMRDKFGLIVQNLKKGETIESFDTKRPNVNITAFRKEITGMLAASEGMAGSIYELNIDGSYSSARVEVAYCENVVQAERERFGVLVLDNIYAEWAAYEIQHNGLVMSGFYLSALVKAAWLNNKWIGVSKPDIDPVKTAVSLEKYIAMGIKTHEEATLEVTGGRWSANIEKIKNENEKVNQAFGNEESK
jgi:capsid protein